MTKDLLLLQGIITLQMVLTRVTILLQRRKNLWRIDLQIGEDLIKGHKNKVIILLPLLIFKLRLRLTQVAFLWHKWRLEPRTCKISQSISNQLASLRIKHSLKVLTRISFQCLHKIAMVNLLTTFSKSRFLKSSQTRITSRKRSNYMKMPLSLRSNRTLTKRRM